jgi:hypothetical protein
MRIFLTVYECAFISRWLSFFQLKGKTRFYIITTMGNACSCCSPITVKNTLTQDEISNISTEFNKFQETHCEFSEAYFTPFNELCAAFWSYAQVIKNMDLSAFQDLINSIVKSLHPELKLSGFLLPYAATGSKKNYAYVVGMRLKTFPLLPEVVKVAVL